MEDYRKNYIAYGSNLNKEQMQTRCPNSKIVGTSIIKNYRLLFKGSDNFSYLTIEKEDKCSLPVAIYSITKEDEIHLDEYEGFPSFYYKKEFSLEVDGKQIEAFAYIMDERNHIAKPSQHYLETCLQGYKDFGFDRKFLDEALKLK